MKNYYTNMPSAKLSKEEIKTNIGATMCHKCSKYGVCIENAYYCKEFWEEVEKQIKEQE